MDDDTVLFFGGELFLQFSSIKFSSLLFIFPFLLIRVQRRSNSFSFRDLNSLLKAPRNCNIKHVVFHVFLKKKQLHSAKLNPLRLRRQHWFANSICRPRGCCFFGSRGTQKRFLQANAALFGVTETGFRKN